MTSRRLPPRDGEWIDRSQTVEFRFEGKAYSGFAGDVISSALWASDVRLLGRSFKYHRPRGIYSLAGHDANVMLEDGHRTNIRGDLMPLEADLNLRSVNTAGGVERDRLRLTEWFSRFMPVGFYYKAFHSPRRLFPFYENQMRKVAGLGRINPGHRCPPSPKDYAFCDLLVVGAGPAGMSAAIAAAEQGADVLLVDEQPRPGGSLAWRWAGDSTAKEILSGLMEQISASDRIQLRCGTRAVGCYGDHLVGLVDENRLTKLRTKAILVATGCFEQPAVFQNNDLPGVMLGSAAQRLISLFAVKPFDRAVVLAANSDGYRAALNLHSAGVAVSAIVDLRHEGEPSEPGQAVVDQNIPVHKGHAIYEAMPTAGKKRIRGAVLCPLNSDGSLRPETRRVIDCDGIAMSVGGSPNGGLIYQAGGRFSHSENIEQLVPSELPPGVFAAGRVNGVFALDDQIDDGYRAGLSAAHYMGRYQGEIPETVLHTGSAPTHPFPIFAHPGKKNFVDLDEDLHLADFENAHQEGYDSIELMKRFTTVGMGPTQGKLSNINAVRILARLNDASINETGTTTSRPFQQPVPISHLAGRRFHPLRRTPLHSWHMKAGAELIHAGAWLRPEYYRREGQSRNDCILNEATNVRNHVGLIDVSTLGKLQINGPDAIRFLEFLYTGRFEKQPVGRLRYGIACDETGVIIEDGIVARMSEDQFYVTATSSGAAAFYREMQRWALIQKMDVTLVNVTGHTAAMNLAGPKCREVLQELTEIDLSAASFPYLAAKDGAIAGVSVTLLRVGFVGELGFEIHVPTSSARHVWQALIQAGERFGIQPFGLEAQRLLRLEKGHLIVGQDTDALTNPFEADVAWAIGKNKQPFVGSRSLDIIQKKPLTRRLVGIAFPKDHHSPLPKECHLIIEGQEIVGRITSIAPRSTLGHPIAMAFLSPDLATIGSRVTIRVDGGSLVDAHVAEMPFYDPKNLRQQD